MQATSRKTHYTTAVLEYVLAQGHATNAEVLASLRKTFPELSATTVHRITTRLAERGELGIAPNTPDGSLRYDANTKPHDHFTCSHCAGLRDITVDRSLRESLETKLGGCQISGQLLIQGSCSICNKEGTT